MTILIEKSKFNIYILLEIILILICCSYFCFFEKREIHIKSIGKECQSEMSISCLGILIFNRNTRSNKLDMSTFHVCFFWHNFFFWFDPIEWAFQPTINI
jgi:hypothetical protein